MLRPRPLALAFFALAATALIADANAGAPVTAATPDHASPRATNANEGHPARAPKKKRAGKKLPPSTKLSPGIGPRLGPRLSPRLAPGSRGTLAWAIARRRPKVRAPVAEGSLPEPLSAAALTCPAGMASIEDRFCVDVFEASLVEILSGGATSPWPAFTTPDDARAYRAESAKGVMPQAYISGTQAASACHAAGKRLCEPVEWRHACGGTGQTAYPYGAAHEDGKCNDRGTSPMLVYYPQVERSWSLVGMIEMNDPRLNQLPGTVAKTGELQDCVNDFGLHDMVGNLHEWTADPNGTFQGGYYLDTSLNGDGCSYRTAAHDFAYHDYSTGFRCCADGTPEAVPRDDDESDDP